MAGLAACFSKKGVKREQQQQGKGSFMAGKQVLLLGRANSGKTTIIKQLNYYYYHVLFDDHREVIKDIKNIIRDALVRITTKMSKLDPPVELTDPERQCHVDYIQNHVAQRSEFSAEFFEHAKALWQDEGVKECFLRSNEYGSIDFAKYFLDRVDIAKQVDYVPTVQDYFRCKSLYASRPDPDFLIMEWPSQCHVHKYLRLAMLDIHMCIFVIDCSNFNEYEPGFEDEPILKETLFVLKSLLALSCRYCEQAAFLIFLNKQDQLATKLLSGRWKLEDYFPEFVHYSTPHDASSEPGEDPMVTRAKYFIRDLCLEILKGINKDEEKFFVQFTSATDTDNMSQVFKNCTSFLKRHRILL